MQVNLRSLQWQPGPSAPDKPARCTIAGMIVGSYHAPRTPSKRNVVPFRMACMAATYRKVRLPIAA